MKSEEQIILIEGNFTDVEAKEILMNVISTKIQFHSMKNFSSKERFGKVDELSVKRIAALGKSLEAINEFLSQPTVKNHRLKIHATIHLSISE